MNKFVIMDDSYCFNGSAPSEAEAVKLALEDAESEGENMFVYKLVGIAELQRTPTYKKVTK